MKKLEELGVGVDVAVDWVARNFALSREEAFERVIIGSVQQKNGRLCFDFVAPEAPRPVKVRVEADGGQDITRVGP